MRRSYPHRVRARGSALPALARAIALLAVAVSALCVLPKPAQALETPFTNSKVQLLGGLRFGTDDYNLGVGFRGGYTLPMNVYVGGTFDYFFGEHDDWAGPNNLRYEYDASAWAITADGGYDFALLPTVMIRPFAGLTIVHYEWDFCDEAFGTFGCWEDDDTDVGLTLGGILNIKVGPILLGPEVRLLASDLAVFMFGANIGGQL